MAVAPSVDPVTTTSAGRAALHPVRGLDHRLRVARPPRGEEAAEPGPRDVRQAVSAGWVIPVDGPPIADAFVAWEDGRIVEVGPGRADRHYADALILPGLVNAHSHLEYAVYAGFGDGLAFGGWLATHIARKRRARRRRHGRDRPARRRRVARIRDHDDRRLQLLRRGRDRRERPRASARSSTSRSSAATRPRRSGGSTASGRRSTRPSSSGSGSRRTRPTPARSTSTATASRSGSRSARISPRATARTSGSSTAPARSPPPATCSCRRAAGGRSGRSRRSSGPELLCAHCVAVEEHEIAELAAADVPVAHCPRSNALLGCGVAPLTALRAAGIRVGLGTDSPASTPSFDAFDELRAAARSAPARASGGPTRSTRPGRSGSLPWMQRAPWASKRTSAAFPPASEPT